MPGPGVDKLISLHRRWEEKRMKKGSTLLDRIVCGNLTGVRVAGSKSTDSKNSGIRIKSRYKSTKSGKSLLHRVVIYGDIVSKAEFKASGKVAILQDNETGAIVIADQGKVNIPGYSLNHQSHASKTLYIEFIDKSLKQVEENHEIDSCEILTSKGAIQFNWPS